MANTKRASNANKTNQKQSGSAKGKSRDKDLSAFDDKQIDKAQTKTEAIEAFINKISHFFISLPRREKAFFKKMIDDVKSQKIDGFELDDFYFLTKFDGESDVRDEARGALCYYFSSICNLAKQEAKQQENKNVIECYENFKRAVGILEFALPRGYLCNSLKDLEEYKGYLDDNVIDDLDFQKAELVAYFAEFLKKANNYFNGNETIRYYLDKGTIRQQRKDNFRDKLRTIADFYKIKAVNSIDDGKLTQNIYNYVMENFADFLAEYEKTENENRLLA